MGSVDPQITQSRKSAVGSQGPGDSRFTTHDSLILCETCLERGRERPADVVTEHLQMCADCFNGKPFRREEEFGGFDAGHVRRQIERQQRNAEHIRQVRAEWRERNRERLRSYARNYYRTRRQRTDEQLSMSFLGRGESRVASSE